MNQAAHHIEEFAPPRPRGSAYGAGYTDGARDGERWANTRLLWIGMAIGVLACGAIVLGAIWLGYSR